MIETLINGLAIIGGIVVSIAVFVGAYITFGLLLIYSEKAVDKTREWSFYYFGGIANADTKEYKPPRPPWDRLRYELVRIKYYNQVLQVKLGVKNSVSIQLNGVQAVYNEREKYHD